MRFAQLDPRHEPARVERIWRSLLETCPHHYFLSWGWISTWLDSLPAEQETRLVAGFVDEAPALAFFLGTTIRKNAAHSWRIAALNATGNPYFDKIYQEYNAVLAHPDIRLDFDLFQRACHQIRWDELRLPGLAEEFTLLLGSLKDQPTRYNAFIEDDPPAFYIDLERVRQHNLDYQALLSSNKRSQIRRSIKEYEKDGPITLQEAQTPQEALAFLHRLAEYHEREWQQRGQPGAFSNAYFFEFHRELIARRFQHGEIQLLRIATPGTELGYLYNFVYQGWIYCYQSGFNYLPGNIYRPGLISDYFAILHNARLGHQAYDFMAGDSEYKRSLATDSRRMHWMRLFRSRPAFLAWQFFNCIKTTARRFPVVYNLLMRLKKRVFPKKNER